MSAPSTARSMPIGRKGVPLYYRTAGTPRRDVSPSHPRPTTPSSSRSSASYADLEDVVQDVVGLRMSSLYDLRRKIEELSSLQEQEEKSFQEAMQLVLDQSSTAKELQKEAEEDYEVRLRKEKNERQKALEIMVQFKKEGSTVMLQLKENLREVQAKYKAELEKNAKLTTQLRKYEKQSRHMGGDSYSSPDPYPTAAEDSPRSAAGGGGAGIANEEVYKLRTQVETLSQLLEEEDQVIMELQQRNRSLEGKVRVLSEQREKLLEVEAQQNQHFLDPAEFEVEYIDNLKRFSLLLMQRLKSEQRQRLQVEEQAAKMAAAQDDLLSKLEDKMKGMEKDRNPTTGTTPGASFGHNSVGAPSTAQVGGPAGAPQPAAVTTKSRAAAAQRLAATGRGSPPGNWPERRHPGAGPNPASPPSEPKQQELVGLETIDMDKDTPAADIEVKAPQQRPVIPPVNITAATAAGAAGTPPAVSSARQQGQGQVTAASSVNTSQISSIAPDAERGRSTVASDALPSLEEQLQLVSADFEISLQQWSTAIEGGADPAAAAKDLALEQEFLPESP